MRALTLSSAKDLILARPEVSACVDLSTWKPLFNPRGALRPLEFTVPDSLNILLVAKPIVSLICSRARSQLLWILTDSGAFPSFSHSPLLESVMRSEGVTTSFTETPAFLLNPDEVDVTVSLTYLSNQFLWDSLLIDLTDGTTLALGHERIHAIGLQTEDEEAKVYSLLAELELQPVRI